MADVFISYHEKTEGKIAAEIASKLESAGITCWYAKRDISVGKDFTHEVITQIEKCKVFLLLLDKGASHSRHVETEVGNAFKRDKKIMPYQTDKKDIKSVSWVQYYLKQVQIVPLPDYNQLAAEIATALGRPVQTVTPEPQSAESNEETKPTALLDSFVVMLMLIFIIVSSIVGFTLGNQSSGVSFFSNLLFDGIELSDFSSGVLGAFSGYSISWFVSLIIYAIIPATRDSLPYTEEILGFLMMTWFIIAPIVGAIVGYTIGGILGGIIGVIVMPVGMIIIMSS